MTRIETEVDSFETNDRRKATITLQIIVVGSHGALGVALYVNSMGAPHEVARTRTLYGIAIQRHEELDCWPLLPSSEA